MGGLAQSGFGLGCEWFGGVFLGFGWYVLGLRIGVLCFWARRVVLGHGGLSLGVWACMFGDWEGLRGPVLGLGEGFGVWVREQSRGTTASKWHGTGKLTRHGKKRNGAAPNGTAWHGKKVNVTA